MRPNSFSTLLIVFSESTLRPAYLFCRKEFIEYLSLLFSRNRVSRYLYLLIFCISYGCIPQTIQQPPPDSDAAADLAQITELGDYYNSLKTLSPEELNREHAQTIDSLHESGSETERLILLTLSLSLSEEQLADSKKLLAEIDIETTSAHASSKKLLILLLDLARERVLFLSKIEQTSHNNKVLQKQKNQLVANLSQCEKKTNTLFEQIKKLEEIEKIIIKRKKADTPHI